MSILLFIHPQVVPKLCEFLSSTEHKRGYFEDIFGVNYLNSGPFRFAKCKHVVNGELN